VGYIGGQVDLLDAHGVGHGIARAQDSTTAELLALEVVGLWRDSHWDTAEFRIYPDSM
jgi:hypothetical protein